MRERSPDSMVHRSFFIRRHEFPIRAEPGINSRIPRDHEAVDTDLFKQTARFGLLPNEIFGFVQIDLTMDPEIEIARDAAWENWAVTIYETQPGPHRSAPRPNNLSDWFRLLRIAIGMLRLRINAQV